jgi:regulatory protein
MATPSAAVSAPTDVREARDSTWHTTWADDAPVRGVDGESEPTDTQIAAEAALLKKLRVRSLSVREARDFLLGEQLSADQADAVLDALVRHGYLDDIRLAEQLVYSGSVKKGQGRQAIARTLAQRGIPRDIVDAALSDAPDDDHERALDYARHKAGAFRGVDRDTALRRLVGQLSRRGYPGQVAMAAARTALDEVARPAVRFE